MRGGHDSVSDPLGELTALPQTPSCLGEGKGRRKDMREGKEMDKGEGGGKGREMGKLRK